MNATSLLMAAVFMASWQTMTPAERSTTLSAGAEQAFEQRFESLSRPFMGTAYGESPLGEAQAPDADPLIRFDRVDCLTFVEEMMALSYSRSEDEVVGWLNRIRYAHDVPRYGDRNHVMEAQWLPVNLKKGFIVDVTQHYGGASVKSVTKTLTAQSWQSRTGAALKLAPQDQAVGRFAWDIIPVAQAVGVVKKVPTGTILVAVRADRPDRVTRITHLGFVVQTAKGPMLRHASRTFKKVVDEPLDKFVKRNLGYAKWTVEGVSLFSVRSPT